MASATTALRQCFRDESPCGVFSGDDRPRFAMPVSGVSLFASDMVSSATDRAKDHSEPIFFSAINSLDDPQFRLRRSVWVMVARHGEDNFVANCSIRGIAASGDTVEEAIANFKDIFVGKYRFFHGLGKSKLGPLPLSQYQQLSRIIEERC